MFWLKEPRHISQFNNYFNPRVYLQKIICKIKITIIDVTEEDIKSQSKIIFRHPAV